MQLQTGAKCTSLRQVNRKKACCLSGKSTHLLLWLGIMLGSALFMFREHIFISMKKLITATFILIALSACASHSGKSFEERDAEYVNYISKEKLAEKRRVTTFKYEEWRSLSDRYVILQATYKKYYLVELKRRCFGLRIASALFVNSASSLSLEANYDSITTDQDRLTKCVIKTIYPITAKQLQDLVTIGKEVQLDEESPD